MDFHNRREALKEAMLDVEEGADIVMVKPAMVYGDLIREVKDHTNIPVAEAICRAALRQNAGGKNYLCFQRFQGGAGKPLDSKRGETSGRKAGCGLAGGAVASGR